MTDGSSVSSAGAAASSKLADRAGVGGTLKPGALRWRAAAWSLYPLLAVGYVVTLVLAPGGMARFGVLEAIYLFPIVGSVALGAVAARASTGVERQYWVLLSAANALLGFCELMLLWWLAFITPNGPAPVTWQFHLVHVLAAACFLRLVFLMTRMPSEGVTVQARFTLDMGAAGLVIYSAILAFYARPVMASVHAPVYAVLVGSGYVLAAAMMSLGTLGNIVGFKLVKWRSWETLTAVAIGVYSIAIALWPLWYTTVSANARNTPRGLLDLIQFSGHFFLMMAAVYRLSETDVWYIRPLPSPEIARRWWARAAIPAISVLTIVVLGAAAFLSRTDPEWFAVFGVLALLLTLLVLARSTLMALEHGRLFLQSVTDPLTGLANHRDFHDQLKIELDRAERYGEPFAVAVIDLDDFNDYNERFGHLEGDRLLAGVGARLDSLAAGDKHVARLGGDEFALLLPNHDARDAAVFTQHVLDVIGVECGFEPGALSASAGVAAFPEHGTDAEQLLDLADGALFSAKETGKARVVVYDAGHVPDLSAHERIERLERHSRVAAVRALAAAVDAHDAQSRSHAQRVANLARRFGEHLGLPPARVDTLELAALVHDVGKIADADSELDGLRSAQLAQRSHPEQGQRILASTGLPELVPAVRSHHERWDGAGFPDGLIGEEIPLDARIVALCDAYETFRTFAEAPAEPPAEDPAAALRARAGSEFDPTLVDGLLTMLIADGATGTDDGRY